MKNKIIWKCVEYNSVKCRGRLHLSREYVIPITNHNHVIDIAKIGAKEAIVKLKYIAKNSPMNQENRKIAHPDPKSITEL